MSQDTRDYERWSALMDRQAAGETLSAEELAFCERMVETNELCRQEQAMLEELGELDGTPTERTRALVDATLAQLEAEGRIPEELPSPRGGGSPRRRVVVMWGAVSVAAAAATILSVGWPQGGDDAQATSREPEATPAPRVELVFTSGEVRVDGAIVRGGADMLDEGSRVEVGTDGAACVAMDPGVDVCLAAGSSLKLSRVHADWRRLDLEHGRVGVRLDHQPDGMRLSVVADGVWSTAVGTAFTVERLPDEAVSTTVLQGKVRVGDGGEGEHLVAAHQRARVQRGEADVSALSRSEESPGWALLEPAQLWKSPVSATLELRGAPEGADVHLDGRPLGIAPLASLVPAGSHRVAVLVDGEVAMRRDFGAAAGQRTVIDFAPMATAQPAAPPPQRATPARRARPTAPEAAPSEQPAPAPPSAAEMLREARALMRGAHWQEAADRYEALREAHPESLESRTVLVPLAQLQLERLDRPSDALAYAERYLDGGRGALAQEARHTRILALRALGRTERERNAIEEFLRLHPRSFQAPALRARLAELSRP